MDPALERLRQALEEYLAAGEDTPVAVEAQALMDAIDSGGDPEGLETDELGLEDAPIEEEPGEMPPPQNAKTFEDAMPGAKLRLAELNKKRVKV